jgi:cell division protein FtsN
MAQKYSKKSSARSAQRKSVETKSSVPAFLAGLVVGILGTQFLPVLLEKKAAAPKDHSQPSSAAESPEFQFPDMLRGTEIRVPENSPADRSTSNSLYLLQVGSFKNPDDAEARQVQLILLNLKASVETFEAASGDTWYRVLIGPFENSSDTMAARAKLSQHKLDSLLLKREIPTD